MGGCGVAVLQPCCTAVWAMALFLPTAWSRGKKKTNKNNIKLKTKGTCWLFSWLFFHRSVLGDAPGWGVLSPGGSCGSGGDAEAVRGYGVCSRMGECELAVDVCVLWGVMHLAVCAQALFAGSAACPPHSSAMGTSKRASCRDFPPRRTQLPTFAFPTLLQSVSRSVSCVQVMAAGAVLSGTSHGAKFHRRCTAPLCFPRSCPPLHPIPLSFLCLLLPLRH